MRINLFIALVVLVVSTSCTQRGGDGSGVNIDSIDLSERESIMSELDTIGAGIPIFYNMYISVELSTLFETVGAVFNKDILNVPDKSSEYITSYKKALNLGVYAVDLSYSRVFDQFEVAAGYFGAMQKLSGELGIPANYFENTAQRFEKNLTNKDSLIAIANEVYYTTEDYLKENERYATASVIILGGWVEAIYIGTHVAIESKNVDIIERLVDQKYSLNNLLIMLNDHSGNEVVADYIKKLEQLRSTLLEINIEVPVDFDGGSEQAADQMSNWLEEITKLQNAILELRNNIIE